MKRFAMILVLIIIFGVSCGGIYQLTFGGGELAAPDFLTGTIKKIEQKQAAKKAEKEEQLLREKEIVERVNAEKEKNNDNKGETEPKSSASGKKNDEIIIPRKNCSIEGCDRAAFVEYNGVKLCIKCYAEAKKQAENN